MNNAENKPVQLEYDPKNHKTELTVPDIRNKLGPIKNLIKLLDLLDSGKDISELIPTELEKCKKSINYLAQREVFPGY